MTAARRKLPPAMQRWWLWFSALFVITFGAFWPSFFSAMAKVDAAIIVHGLSATAWMALAIVQALLIKTRRREVHHLIGYGSIALAAILVLSGFQMLRQMIQRDGTGAAGEPLLAIKFFYIDITALVLFCVFLVLAIMAARRRDIALHLRMVACTALLPLEAALERVFILGTPQLVPDWTTALLASNVTLIALTAALSAIEWRYERMRWPFPFLLGYYLFNLLTVDAVAQMQWFRAFAFAFAGR